jgi:hypothetical protein
VRIESFVPLAGQNDGRGQHVLTVEAGVHPLQPQEAADHQRGAHQQDHRQGDLGDDERVAQPLPAAAGARAARAFFQRIVQVGARHLPSGREPEQHARADGDCGREREHTRVDREHHPERLVGRHGGHDEIEAPQGNHDAEGRATQGEQHALGEQLAHDAEPAGAEGGANR